MGFDFAPFDHPFHLKSGGHPSHPSGVIVIRHRPISSYVIRHTSSSNIVLYSGFIWLNGSFTLIRAETKGYDIVRFSSSSTKSLASETGKIVIGLMVAYVAIGTRPKRLLPLTQILHRRQVTKLYLSMELDVRCALGVKRYYAIRKETTENCYAT